MGLVLSEPGRYLNQIFLTFTEHIHIIKLFISKKLECLSVLPQKEMCNMQMQFYENCVMGTHSCKSHHSSLHIPCDFSLSPLLWLAFLGRLIKTCQPALPATWLTSDPHLAIVFFLYNSEGRLIPGSKELTCLFLSGFSRLDSHPNLQRCLKSVPIYHLFFECTCGCHHPRD